MVTRQGKKSEEVQKFKEEIAKLCSKLISLVSRHVEDRSYLRNINGIDFKTISLLICFFTIYKEYFEDIPYNQFKPKNLLKLSIIFTIIKSCVKYIKMEDSIELATHKDNSITGEPKIIT